ncbi:MAG: hypothetical protein HY674_14350 [Chloroflexi bacterium]|nr:hypothetical protein [Chloroflexota bacterium]
MPPPARAPSPAPHLPTVWTEKEHPLEGRAVVGGVAAAARLVLFVVPILYLLLKGDTKAQSV